MKISESKRGLRVQLTRQKQLQQMLPDGSMPHPRYRGTIRSHKPLAKSIPYAETVGVYVMWDGLRTPEFWDLRDLEPHWLNDVLDGIPARTA